MFNLFKEYLLSNPKTSTDIEKYISTQSDSNEFEISIQNGGIAVSPKTKNFSGLG